MKMKKLVLDLDGLRVDSFSTEGMEGRRGTVRGHDDTMETENCSIDTCLLGTCVKTPLCARTVVNCAAGEE